MNQQVLCRALGGKVGKSKSGWDVGLRNVRFNVKNIVNSDSCSFLNGFDVDDFPQLLSIIECHQDEVLISYSAMELKYTFIKHHFKVNH